ncbi:MAG TPA: hypothetical protein VJ805_04835 [Nitrospiraceae bacterium]|nr:hypothetical protein [Nitrospiraceae bacterium]
MCAGLSDYAVLRRHAAIVHRQSQKDPDDRIGSEAVEAEFRHIMAALDEKSAPLP